MDLHPTGSVMHDWQYSILKHEILGELPPLKALALVILAELSQEITAMTEQQFRDYRLREPEGLLEGNSSASTADN